MCGIIGYVGKRPVLPLLVEGLKKLEYRGYDSAGVAVVGPDGLRVHKTRGKVRDLEELLEAEARSNQAGGRRAASQGAVAAGIGHTRWATHGKPSGLNAHPLQGCDASFAVVHNGIIENHAELRAELTACGHTFSSETDTEVVAHLLEEHYQGDLLGALRHAVARLEGAYALVVAAESEPGRLAAARQGSPLIAGFGEGENFLASDIPALLPHTRRVHILDDGELVDLTANRIRVVDRAGRELRHRVFTVEWAAGQAEKGGYPHFMLKEIFEQPRAIRDTIAGRLVKATEALPADRPGRQGTIRVSLDELELTTADLATIDRVYFVACGTACYASMVGAELVERLARIPTRTMVASEFRSGTPVLDRRTLVVLLSQSGETLDTYEALKKARREGARTLAVCNVVGSTIAREADHVVYTRAGLEIGVASTKAYTTHLVVSTLLAAYIAQERGPSAEDAAGEGFAGGTSDAGLQSLLRALRGLPAKAEQALKAEVDALAAHLSRHEHAFYLGRSLDYFAALEGQHKLKEISYLHAEAYPAGELKHGALALVTRGVPVVVVATQPEVLEKTISNIQEVRAREAWVVAVVMDTSAARRLAGLADAVLTVPETHPLLAPVLAAIPLQKLAYRTAVLRGADVDQPRNLAKSVTVE